MWGFFSKLSTLPSGVKQNNDFYSFPPWFCPQLNHFHKILCNVWWLINAFEGWENSWIQWHSLVLCIYFDLIKSMVSADNTSHAVYLISCTHSKFTLLILIFKLYININCHNLLPSKMPRWEDFVCPGRSRL